MKATMEKIRDISTGNWITILLILLQGALLTGVGYNKITNMETALEEKVDKDVYDIEIKGLHEYTGNLQVEIVKLTDELKNTQRELTATRILLAEVKAKLK